MHFQTVGEAEDAFPDGRRSRRCISRWSERHNKKVKYKWRCQEIITAEVSLYPQKTTSASEIITDSLNSLKGNLKVDVGSVSTRLQGSEGEVWEGLKTLFESAGTRSEVNMVVTLSNSAG